MVRLPQLYTQHAISQHSISSWQQSAAVPCADPPFIGRYVGMT